MRKPSLMLFLFLLLLAVPALAAAPEPWQFGFQQAASPVKDKVVDFHNLLLPIITVICVVVLGLLLFVMVRFRASANPEPKRFTHNVPLEIIWTAVPVLILLVIAVPSFRLLYYGDKAPNAALTIKAVGHQWYWEYEYPDHGIKFTSLPIADTDLLDAAKMTELSRGWLVPTAEPQRLLEVDNRVVIPVGVDVRIQTTAGDVLHAWAVPAFGVKKDAIPGRLNETWVHAKYEGVYYGQCSEICGTGHGFMPIAVEAVSAERFAAWVAAAQQQFPMSAAPQALRVAQSGEQP